jgi:hypothetical protein
MSQRLFSGFVTQQAMIQYITTYVLMLGEHLNPRFYKTTT